MGKIIDVDENVFNGVSSQCNNAASSVEGSKGKLGPCFSGKLLSYYNSSCNNKIDSQITSISNNLQNLSTSIQGAMKAYQATDENLAIGFEALIDEIFNYSDTDLDDFSFDQEFSSSNLSSVEERKQYIENLINTYSEVLNNIKNEFSSKYSEAYGRHYLDNIDPKTYAVLDTLMTCFINGGSYYGDGSSYNPNTNKGSCTIEQLRRFNNFIKENNLSKTLDSYFSGKSWDASGMSTFNDIVAGNLTGSNYNYGEYDKNVVSDCVEASFLGHFYYNLKKLGLGDGIECTTLGGNISNLVNGGTNNVDKNEVAKIKNLMGDYYKNTFSYQSRFDDKENKYGLLDYIDTRVNEYDSYVSDIKLIESTIYNYRQAKELFTFQKYIESKDFQEFLENDFKKLKDMYSKNIGSNSKYLDDEEIALYGYLFDKVSPEEAKSYLKALTDKINNGIGMEEALNFIKDRDELGMDFGDALVTMFVGESDGVEGFFEGIGKFWFPIIPRTALDYKKMYLMEMLNHPDKYGLNDLKLTEADRKIIEVTYNTFYGAGNMLVPQLISLAGGGAPAISAMALALLGTSAAGHATNDAVLSGHGLLESYLYGGLIGASEALFESIGGVLGLGDTNLLNFSGWSFVKEYVKSMVKEGTEEFFQEYFDAGLRAVIFGEPFDLGETTNAALVAGLYGMAVAGVMNTSTIAIKIGGKIYNVTFDSLKNMDFSEVKNNEDLINNLAALQAHDIKVQADVWVKTRLKSFLCQFFNPDLVDKIDVSKIHIFDTEEEFTAFMKSKNRYYDYDGAGGAHFERDGVIAINVRGNGVNSLADVLGNIMHECIHDMGNIFGGKSSVDCSKGLIALNESITEMFVKHNIRNDSDTKSYGYRTAYDRGIFGGLEYLFGAKIPGLEYSDFETAYFEKKSIADIAQRINDIMGDSNFFEDELLTAFESRDYDTIRAKIRKICIAAQNGGS